MPADRVIAYLVDIVVGVEQGNAVAACRDRRLQRKFTIQSLANQFGLEGIVALRAKWMTILEAIIGERLAEINAGIFRRHAGYRSNAKAH